MATKTEKKETFGGQIQLGAIMKTAALKRGEGNKDKIREKLKKERFFPMPVKVPVKFWEDFSTAYYELVKELGEEFVSITRSDVFISLIKYMDKNIDIDTSKYKDFYDTYIGIKGKRPSNDRTFPPDEKMANYCWANFTKEELNVWKNLLTKLAIKVGVERREDFSKQYFMSDIIDFFLGHIPEIVDFVREEKNKEK